jgi:pimeloyl-ACP methyl ester carboxylesterase
MMRPILIPTLFIWGEREPVFIPETLEGWDEWVPELRVERLPGIGHFIPRDAPERLNELLIEFATAERRATRATARPPSP